MRRLVWSYTVRIWQKKIDVSSKPRVNTGNMFHLLILIMNVVGYSSKLSERAKSEYFIFEKLNVK